MPKKKSKKWIFALIGIVLVLGIGGGVFGYVNYQKSQTINTTNIVNYLKSHNYQEKKSNEGSVADKGTFYLIYNKSYQLNNNNDSTSTMLASTAVVFGASSGYSAIYEIKLGYYVTGTSSNPVYVRVPPNGEAWLIITGGKSETLTSLSQIPSAK